MDSVLLDTDVFSFFFRADSRGQLYEGDVRGKIRCLSFATVAELRFGAIARSWGQTRCQQLENAIAHTVIIPCDTETTRHWAEIKAARMRIGRPVSSEDCWNAAIARRHQIPLLTHNGADYRDIQGLVLITH